MRTAVAIVAAIATAVGVGACGTSVPSNAVAVVGSFAISKTSFNHWLTVFDDIRYVGTGETPPPVPVPPDYTTCISATRAEYTKGAKPPATSVLKSGCASSYTQLTQSVMALLVEDAWVQGEAYDKHVHVTQAAINKEWTGFEKQITASTKLSINTYLAESAATEPDLKWYLRDELDQEAITKKVDAALSKVTEAQIASYYHAHIAQYTQPARRNIELVLASNAAIAAKAKSLLAGGESFKTVASKYSIDPTTKDAGGVEDGVEQGEETPPLNAAIFKDPIGTLEGPLKTAFGYYVFKVIDATPLSVESLKAAATTIKAELISTRDSAALTKLQTTFTKSWRARTTCASAYMDATVCANAPTTGSSGASGTSGAS
jgi:foldase protein PrsA